MNLITALLLAAATCGVSADINKTVADAPELTPDMVSCGMDTASMLQNNTSLEEVGVSGKTITNPDGIVMFVYSYNATEVKTHMDECEKIEGMKWRTLSDAYDCTYNGDERIAIVKNYTQCIPDTDSCNKVALTEYLYLDLKGLGFICGADGKSMDVSYKFHCGLDFAARNTAAFMNIKVNSEDKTITHPDGSVELEYSYNAADVKTAKDECENIEGMKWRALSDTTSDCTYNGDKRKVTVKNYGVCYPGTDSCNKIALTEIWHDTLELNGIKCGKSMDVSSTSSASSTEAPMKLLSFAALAVASVAMLM